MNKSKSLPIKKYNLDLDYKKLLDFIILCEKESGDKTIYGLLDKFLKDQININSMIVFSIKKEIIKDVFNHRILWNRNIFESEFSGYLFNKMIEDIKSFNKVYWEYKGDVNTYLIFGGDNQMQSFWVAFKCKRRLNENFLSYLSSYLSFYPMKMKKLKEFRVLEAMIFQDDITNLYNRRKLLKDLHLCIKRYEEFGEPFSVFFIDLDNFKEVNDRYGHMVGTRLISDMAHLLSGIIRETDMIYRYGGDEFMLVLQGIEDSSIDIIAKRLIDGISKNDFIIYDKNIYDKKIKINITASIGVATYPWDASSISEIIATADRMMYMAKEQDRGKVVRLSSKKPGL